MATQNKSTTDNDGFQSAQEHVKAAAADVYNQGKKIADEWYEGGRSTVAQAEEQVKEYSDALITKIKEKPLSSILVAAGVGFILSTLLKK